MKLRIKEVMKEKGISIEGLRTAIEENGGYLSRTSISNIVNGKSIPKVDTLSLIAGALRVDISTLFSRNSIYGVMVVNGKEKVIRSVQDLEKVLEEVR